MAGKHSADDDFNPYRRQNSRTNGEDKSKNLTQRNDSKDYVRNNKGSKSNSSRTIKGKTGEVEEVERGKKMPKKNTKKKHRGLKILAIFLLVIAIIVLLVAGGAFYFINDKIGKMQQVDINEGNLDISTNENLEGYRNIAIFGVDSRSNDLDVGNRSDCIIIANINNKTYPSYPGHTGVDVNINVTGKNVVAVKAGTVVISTALRNSNGTYRSYGEYVVINHHDGTMTLYAHMLSGSRKVDPGDTVVQGQILGTVGSTGNSTGTHLHFEVKVNGRSVNPLPYLP